MSRHKNWTDQEYAFLLDNKDWPASELAEYLGRSTQSIYVKLHRIRTGVEESIVDVWSDEEISLLKNPNFTSKDLTEMLPGRSESAVKTKRTRLQIDGLRLSKSPHSVGGRLLIAKTCRICGLILPAGRFGYMSRLRMWKTYCKKCASDRTNKYVSLQDSSFRAKHAVMAQNFNTKMQKITKAKASRHNFPYIEDDIKVMSNPDMSILEKALMLGRTWSAVAAQCQKNGYKSHASSGDPERDMWIIDNPNAKEYAS